MRSAWLPARTWWQLAHVPQPWSGQSSAAAKARAATLRPEPGGPVSSHACAMPPAWLAARPPSTSAAAAAACRSSAITASCPVSSANTSSPPVWRSGALTGPPARPGAPAPLARTRPPRPVRRARLLQLLGDVRLPELLRHVRLPGLALGRERAGDGRERAGHRLRRRWYRIGQQLTHPVLDLAADLVGRPGRVEHHVAAGLGVGELAEPGPDPVVELRGLGLEPVRGAGPPAEPVGRRQVEQDREIRGQPAGRPPVDPGHLAERQAPAVPW